MEIELENGKYHYIDDQANNQQYALRYGEMWRDLKGDKLVNAMAKRIAELEDANSQLSHENKMLNSFGSGEQISELGCDDQSALEMKAKNIKSVLGYLLSQNDHEVEMVLRYKDGMKSAKKMVGLSDAQEAQHAPAELMGDRIIYAAITPHNVSMSITEPSMAKNTWLQLILKMARSIF